MTTNRKPATPRVRTPRRARTNDVPSLPAAVGHEAILLVEDDPPLRQLFRWTLRLLGYRLLEACNGREALHLLKRHPGRVDLVITDVVMPLLDGFDLAAQVVADRPETRILFVTAYADESVAVQGGLALSGHPFLLKPFTAERLAVKVREVLDHPPATHASVDATPGRCYIRR